MNFSHSAPTKSAPLSRWKTNLVIAFFILFVGLGLHGWFAFTAGLFSSHSIFGIISLSAVPYAIFALSALAPSSLAHRLLLLHFVAVLVAFDLLLSGTWTATSKEACVDMGFLSLIEGVFALLCGFIVVCIAMPDDRRWPVLQEPR